MPYALYYATTAAPQELTPQKLGALVPVHFSTEKDALHAAALVLRRPSQRTLLADPRAVQSPVE
jgi:hypothetical protein